ncbi:MAG: sugar ABC transporter permease [Anaerolineae bacterium]|nr:sugar ABC transporter permease [Anaerolineae bacterium]
MALSEISPRSTNDQSHLVTGKRRRKIQEAVTGYLFVLPATLATFIFGLWPVVAGFYESIKSGSPITNKYVGLDNYVRSLGSLTYIVIFALSLILIYLAYRYWRGMIIQEDGSNPWHFLIPGLLAGAGLIVFVFKYVTSMDGYSWVPVSLFLAAVGGYYTVDQLQKRPDERDMVRVRIGWLLLLGIGVAWIAGPPLINEIGLGIIGWLILVAVIGGLIYFVLPHLGRISSGSTITASLLMGTLMLLAILLARYGVAQMEANVKEAQEVATLIFNQEMLDGSVDITDNDARINGLTFEDGEILVQVEIDGETIEAPLAPEMYNEIPADQIARLEAAFVNNQKVQVILPDGTIAEGQLTGLPAGERLSVGFLADDPQSVREIDLYSALDVGVDVVQNGGHTEPLRKQIYGALAIFISIGTIYTMTWVRRQLDDEENPRLYRWLHWGRIALALVVAFALFYLIGSIQLNQQVASGMGALTEDQFDRAYRFATGEKPHASLRPEVLKAQLLYWPQVFLTAVGALLIGAAYLVWRSAQKRETPLGFGATIMLALLMMIGGWLTLSEIPQTLALGGRETEEAMNSLTRTAMYSIGTVPIQLALGLVLAYLLFSEISWGKSFFRVIYFMPYIAPSVATSTVFLVIFRMDQNSLANRALSIFGLKPLTWLKEPDGIVRVFYEQVLGGNPLNIPEGLAGPSLALTTVILYNIWVFAGYNAVVFLAGLGAIPTELYEAAEVDGAGRWSRFRSITLPLLSPTTFFLSMLSIIGTFKAFSHIYVLRRLATGKEIDTMSVHIFNTLYSANNPGYAAALAFSLFGVILILTLVQNRLAREQVFYG